MAYQDPNEPLCQADGPLRPNVAALIVKQKKGETRLLLGERIDWHGAWQWPQGGLDPGEDAEQGLRREVLEETGLKDFEVLYRFPFQLTYQFPISLAKKFEPYVGQSQQYFLVTPKKGRKPDLKRAKDKEFRALAWVPFDQALDNPVWFKRAVYQQALDHARQVLLYLGWPGV
ncbi:MAG: RNA pyrophosphohydrolase [Acidobacteria bacterium]|nr:RNA pyrophosphohydrolase [Acidobacteriota bacterium]MCB9398166.1 RNA pyrophosphohydrolase [Acidobacteriota bacterium]